MAGLPVEALRAAPYPGSVNFSVRRITPSFPPQLRWGGKSLEAPLPPGHRFRQHAEDLPHHGDAHERGVAAHVEGRRDLDDVGGRAGGAVQSSVFSPGSRLNSAMFAVTSTAPRRRAWAAIRRSYGPIGVPLRFKSARRSPASSASSASKGSTAIGA